MGAMLTLLFLAIVAVYGLVRLRSANKAAAERDRREKVRKDKERREAAQQELAKSLERVKNPDQLEQARSAIQRDPKHAAKVVSKMLREKNLSE